MTGFPNFEKDEKVKRVKRGHTRKLFDIKFRKYFHLGASIIAAPQGAWREAPTGREAALKTVQSTQYPFFKKAG
jgi:hypothetical protein